MFCNNLVLMDFMLAASLPAGWMRTLRIFSGQWVNSVWLLMREGRIKNVKLLMLLPTLFSDSVVESGEKGEIFIPLNFRSLYCVVCLLRSWDFLSGNWKVEKREKEDSSAGLRSDKMKNLFFFLRIPFLMVILNKGPQFVKWGVTHPLLWNNHVCNTGTGFHVCEPSKLKLNFLLHVWGVIFVVLIFVFLGFCWFSSMNRSTKKCSLNEKMTNKLSIIGWKYWFSILQTATVMKRK